MSELAPPRRRGRLIWSLLIVVALGVAGIVVGAVVATHHAHRTPAAFVAAPGKVRITPQVSSGSPMPQLVTVGSSRVSFSLGSTSEDAGRPIAGLSVAAQSEPGQPSKDFANYSVGDVITLGQVHITILAIYVEPDQANDAVDVQITRG